VLNSLQIDCKFHVQRECINLCVPPAPCGRLAGSKRPLSRAICSQLRVLPSRHHANRKLGTRSIHRAYTHIFVFHVSTASALTACICCSVRNLDQFHTYQLLSASSQIPLLTLWTTSYCPTCRTVEPLIKSMVESGVGEAEGGVAYCTVEYDAPDVMATGLGLTYMINSIPTLLSFDAQEAQIDTKVSNGRQLSDRRFLEEWCVPGSCHTVKDEYD